MPKTNLDDANSRQVLVWDLAVRITHWGLALSFIGAYVTNRLGVNYFKYHAWCGYTATVLIVFRIVWGIIGTHHARFVNFIRGPIVTARYAWNWFRGRDRGHAGHNPLGAWMVIALLLAMLAQAITGLFANDDIFNFGPLYGYVSNEFSLQLTSWHRRIFDWIAIAVAVHVLAVLVHVFWKKEPLLRAMLTGRKPIEPADAARKPEARLTLMRGIVAITLIAVSAAALATVIATAPVAELSFE